MAYRLLFSLALLAHGAGQVSAQHYSNATHTPSPTTSSSTSTVFLTLTDYSTITSTAPSSSYPTIPKSSYVSLVTTGLQSLSYDNPSNVSVTLTPYAEGFTYTWYQAIFPTILGTVYVVINNLNQTKTYTSTDSAALASNTMYLQNGTLVLLTRSDVNEAGTVTTEIVTSVNGSTIVAYPTPFYTIPGPINWDGFTPTIQSGTTCCYPFETWSPVPQNHYPFPSSTGSTNSRDPSGWLYSMGLSGIPYTGSKNLSSILAPATINSVLDYCPFEECTWSSAAAAASAVQEVGDLLTTTIHVTVSSSSTARPTANANALSATEAPSTSSRTASSVEVDPITASVTGATESGSPGSNSEQSDAAQSSQGGPVVKSTSQQTGDTATPPVSPSSTTLGQSQVSSTVSSEAVESAPAATSSAGNAASIVASIFGAHTTVTVLSTGASSSASPAATQTQSAVGQSAALAQPGSGSQSLTGNAVSQLAPIPVGSTSVAIEPVSLSTVISGISSVFPGIIIGSQTVSIGATVSVDNTPVAVVTSNSQTYVVVGSSTSPFQQIAASPSSASEPLPLVVGSSTITRNSDSQYVVSGQTLAPGSYITIGSGSSKTVIGLQTTTSQTLLVVGSSTSTLRMIPQTGTSSNGAPTPITIGSAVLSPAANSGYIFGSGTLSLGGSITLGSGASTTVVALQTLSSKTLLIIGSSTSTVEGNSPITPPTSQAARPITVGFATITPNSASEYIIGSQTLLPGGPAVTVSGTRYSLASGATEIVIGSSTEMLTSEAGLASYIWDGIGGVTRTSNSQAAATGESSLLSSYGSSSDVVHPSASSTTGAPAPNSPAGSQSTTATRSDARHSRAGSIRAVFVSALALAFVVCICM